MSNESQPQASPRPQWTAEGCGIRQGSEMQGLMVSKAHASLVVRCVNAHDGLVEALKAAHATLIKKSEFTSEYLAEWTATMNQINAAMLSHRRAVSP